MLPPNVRDKEYCGFLSSKEKFKSSLGCSENGIFSNNFDNRNLIEAKNKKGNSFFAGREIKIRGTYSLKDKFWEKVYYCMGNRRGIKELQVHYGKKYLLRKIVKHLSADEISAKEQKQLKDLIKGSWTFQTKKHKIDSIALEDLMRIRLEVEKKVFVDQIDESLVEKKSYRLWQGTILNDLGESYYKNKEYMKAIECYECIINLPHFCNENEIISKLQKLAHLYELVNDKANEIKILKILESIVSGPQVRVRDLEKLCDHYKVRELDKYKNVLKCLGNIYYQNKDYEKAIKYYKNCLAIEAELEKQIEVLYHLIDCYTQSKDNVEIERCYDSILSLPNLPSGQKYIALSHLSKFYSENKNTIKEIETYEQILSCENISEGRIVSTLCDLARLQFNDKDKVVAYYRRAFTITEISKELRLNVIINWLEFYHKTEGIGDPNDLLAILSVVEGIYFHPQKIECLKLIGKLKDLPYNVLYKLAGIYGQMNKDLEEITCYDGILKMSELSPDNCLNALSHLALLYRRTNNNVKARECYKRILNFPEVKPEDQYKALSYLAEEYSSIKGKADKAIQCYKQISKGLGKVAGAEFYALMNLVNIYSRTKRSPLAIKCYEQIKESFKIDSESKFKALKELAILCGKIDKVDREIECYEDILKYPGITQKEYDDAISKLIIIYARIDDNDISLKGFEKMLGYRLRLEDMHIISNHLIRFYGRTKDIKKEIECCEMNLTVIEILKLDALGMLEHLVGLYEKIENTDVKRIICYRKILEISHEESKWLHVLNKLIVIYAQMNDYRKQIQCYEEILMLIDINKTDKIEILKALIYLYLVTDNIKRAIDYKDEILKLDGTAARKLETLMIFLNDVNYGLDQEVIRLINGKTEVESSKILEILGKNPWICFDKDKKLFTEEWMVLLKRKDVIAELECMVLQSLLTVVGLKRDCFLNDKTMSEWNILVPKEGVITDDDWEIVLIDIGEIFDEMCEKNESQRYYLFKFFSQCMASSDAETKVGKQALRKRIVATVDYLKELKIYCNVVESQRAEVKKMIRGAIAIMNVGGMQCTDRAVTFVANLENYIMILKNPNFMPNVMVKRFKFDIIMQGLIDPYYNELGQEESVETYLSYTLKLNRLLGLGLPEGGTMAHEETAKTIPLEEAVLKLNKFLTAENLLDFTATQYVFQIQYEVQKEAALKELREKYAEADEEGNYELATQFSLQLQETEKGFYKKVARKLFEEAGFFAEKV